VLRDAIHEVLGGPDRHDTLYVVGDALVAEPPDGADRAGLETVYLGYRDDRAVGYAIHAAAPGFQDTISLLFGYDPETGTLLGMTVLESKETPGLGDKIYKDLKFVEAFAGVSPPLIGVKAGAGKGAPGEVEMITGATISSRTVIKAINAALERVGPALSAGRKDTP
jgi:Na+-translocating ferredoxin:NAD+ oxidoreductase subunit G